MREGNGREKGIMEDVQVFIVKRPADKNAISLTFDPYCSNKTSTKCYFGI